MFGESGLPNDYSAVADFANRVECAIAMGILVNKRDTVNIPGITNALELIDSDKDPIPVQKLVSQLAFTAYAGPTYDLVLSYAGDNGVPGLSEERGIVLAQEFENLIKETRFYDLLNEDPRFQEVPRDVLEELGRNIDVESIPTPERDAILRTLMPEALVQGRRQRETNRIMTYTFLLELAKRHARPPDQGDLFEVALHPTAEISEHLLPVLDGYLLYRIRDVLAVVHEAVLGEICAELRGYEEAVSSNRVISSILGDEINQALQGIGLLQLDEVFDQVRFLDLVERVENAIVNKSTHRGLTRWEGSLDENLLIERSLKNKREAAGLLPVAWLLCRHRITANGDVLEQHIPPLSHQGQYRMGLREIILPMLNQWMDENPTLDKVISWQIRRTVDQHLRIAWSRMFADVKKDVALLICDGDLWRSRATDYTGGHTASRLPESIGWLKQLSLIDESGLTEAGNEALLRGYQILDQLGNRETDQ